MQELIKALIKAKAEFNSIQKDGTNPHYKRKYATLDAVLDAVTPALGKYGLVIIQTTEIFEGKTVLRTHVFHESGESITSTYPLPEISDSQKFGAALTYARRYAVCAILSVTADEDNDAESATTQKPEQPHNNIRSRKDNQQYRVQPTKQAVTPPSISPKDLRVKEVRTLLNYPLDLVKEWLHSRNVTSPSELDYLQIDELVKTMCLAWATLEIRTILQGCQHTLRLVGSSRDYRKIQSSEHFRTSNDVVLNDAFNILGEIVDAIDEVEKVNQQGEPKHGTGY